MSMANVSPFVLATYPETSPYDFAPLPFNVTPHVPYIHDTVDFVKATRAQAAAFSANPLRRQFYENPYVYHDPDVEAAHIPFVGQPSQCVLPQASCSGPIQVRRRVELLGSAEVLDVQIGGEEFLLRIFGAADSQGFERESKAYATLRHHGAHKRKAVLYCHGWVALSFEDIENITALGGVAASPGPKFPKALLFENLNDFSVVTLETADTYIADNALRSLCVIHSAYVLHGSIEAPHILIIDEETALWFDFTSASVMIGESLRRQDALRELASAWEYFYTNLLPNQRIMWRRSSEDIAREIANESTERLRLLTSSLTTAYIIHSAVSLPPSMRLTPFEIAKSVVSSYPQVSPFSAMPPLPNLRPHPLDFTRDTLEFIAAAHAQAKCTGVNPLYWQHGSCPFAVDSELFEEPIAVTGYTAPPPLPEICEDTKFNFVILQQINETGNVPMFKIRLNGELRLLKIFPDRDPSTEKRPKDGNLNFNPIHNFERERNAYSHLLHYGVCASGVVPQCFGWFELSPSHIADILNFPGISHTAASLGVDVRPPKALVLEFVENATRLSAENITIDIADRVVRGLAAIHVAYVRHGDVAGRNVLVLPQGRVVWIDFDHALCGEGEDEREREQLSRQALLRELVGSWNLCYVSYLPDKRIGFKHWLY